MKEILGWKISMTPALNKKTLLQKYQRPAGLEPLLHVIPQTSICNRSTQKQYYTDYMLLPWTANKIYPALHPHHPSTTELKPPPLAVPKMTLWRIRLTAGSTLICRTDSSSRKLHPGSALPNPPNFPLQGTDGTSSLALTAGQFILAGVSLRQNPGPWPGCLKL